MLRSRVGRRLIQVGFMRRFDPAFVELKAYLDSGELGAARVVHCVHRNAQSHPTATSDGIVVNSMIHELDHLPWLLGEPLEGDHRCRADGCRMVPCAIRRSP